MLKNLFNKTQATVQAPVVPTIAISDEKAEQVIAILATIGMQDEYGFKSHLQRPENYWGGSFEWTDRWQGLRLLAGANPATKQVRDIIVVDHGYCKVTPEQFKTVNEQLAALFN